MKNNTFLLLLLIAVTSTVFLSNLGGAYLLDQDEPLNAECAREMYEQGNWSVPQFNEELRTAKPILLYWLVICSYHVFGVTEFASRLPAGLLSIGTVLCVLGIGTRLFCFRAGMTAALVMTTCVLFAAVGRACTPDPVLVFCTSLTMFCFVYAVTTREQQSGSDGSVKLIWHFVPSLKVQQPVSGSKNWLLLAMYIGTSIAMLAKGPVGLVLPAGIIGLFALFNLEWLSETNTQAAEKSWLFKARNALLRFFAPRRFLQAIWSMKPWLALLPIAIITLPWYVSVAVQTEGEWLNKFIGHDNVGRFMKPLEGHSGPIFYYIPVLLIGLFPWSVFLVPSVMNLYEKIRDSLKRNAQNQFGPHLLSLCFLGCWAGCYLVFFSLAATKLPNYVLPAYPALALLIGFYLDERLLAPVIEKSTLIPWSLVSLISVGCIMTAALPVLCHYLLPGCEWLGGLGVLLMAGGVFAWYAFRTEKLQSCFRALGVTAALFTISVVSLVAPVISHYQESPAIAAYAAKSSAERKWASYDYFSPNLVFYTQQKIHRLNTPTDVTEFLNQPSQRYVVMPEKTFVALSKKIPAKLLYQHRRFLKQENIVLISNAPSLASRETHRQ